MRRAALLVAVVVVAAVGVVTVGTAPASAASVTECQEINSPGTYTLSQDLTNAGTHNPSGRFACILITADGVTLQGNNHVIGDIADTAVTVKSDGVTVTGLRVDNLDTGIELLGASNAVVHDNRIDRGGTGIDVSMGGRNEIRDNVIDGTVDDGISIRDRSTENVVRDNEVTNSGQRGIDVETGATGNEIRANEVRTSTYVGIRVTTRDNVIAGNTVRENDRSGVLVDTTSTNEVSDNTVRRNGLHGIALSGGDGHELRGNQVENNQGAGIHVSGGRDNRILEGNTVTRHQNGVVIVDASGTLVRNVTLTDNGNGTFLRSATSNRLFDNTVTNNDRGFVLRSGSNANVLVDNDAANNGRAAYYSRGGSANSIFNLRLDGSRMVSLMAKDVVIDRAGAPPDGPDPAACDRSSYAKTWRDRLREEADATDTPEVFQRNRGYWGSEENVRKNAERVCMSMTEAANVSEYVRAGRYVSVATTYPGRQHPGKRSWVDFTKLYYGDADLTCIDEQSLAMWTWYADQKRWGPTPNRSVGPRTRFSRGYITAQRRYGVKERYIEAVSSGPAKAGGNDRFNRSDTHVFALLGDPASEGDCEDRVMMGQRETMDYVTMMTLGNDYLADLPDGLSWVTGLNEKSVNIYIDSEDGQRVANAYIVDGELVFAGYGEVERAGLAVRTDEDTVAEIRDADDPGEAIDEAYADGRITVSGVGLLDSVRVGLVKLAGAVNDLVGGVVGTVL